MSSETVTVERYVVCKGMHLGPLRRELRVDDVIEWQPETELMKINGYRIDERDADVSASEAMRQLRVLSELDPENPAIKPIGAPQESFVANLATSTLCILPILGCLSAASDYLESQGGVPELSPITEKQVQFLESFGDLIDEVVKLEELESRADAKVEVINAWLKERGFDIQLPPLTDPKGFAVASIFDLLVEWLHKGKRRTITGMNIPEEYSGVFLKNGVTVSQMIPIHPHPVVRIATKTGETVCMSMVDGIPEGIAGLFLKVAELERVKATSHNFDGVCFPMIDLDDRPDISWIKGLEVGADFRVEAAMQQTKFRMNEFGAKVESAAGMTFTRGISVNRPHVIDRPFLLWIRRDGLEFPLFAAVLCEDVWKEPQEL